MILYCIMGRCHSLFFVYWFLPQYTPEIVMYSIITHLRHYVKSFFRIVVMRDLRNFPISKSFLLTCRVKSTIINRSISTMVDD